MPSDEASGSMRAVDARSGRSRALAWLRWLVPLLGILCCFVLSMKRDVNVYDEGVILTGATQVLHGAVPHRDFRSIYGPGQFFILAALFKTFGVSVLVARLWDLAVRSCLVLLVFAIVRQSASRRLALLAAAASLVWLAGFAFYGYPVFPALAAILAGLILLVPALAQDGTPRRLAGAGAWVGVALLFRYDIGLFTAALEGGLLAVASWLRVGGRAGLGAAIRSVLPFGLGFAAIVVPVLGVFAATGALPDLVFDIVRFPAQFYARMRSLPFPGFSAEPDPAMEFVVYLPPLLCLAAIPSYIAVWRSGQAGQGERRLLLAWLTILVGLTFVFFGKGFVRPRAVQMSMAILTALMLAAVLARPLPGRGPLGRLALIPVLLALAIWTGFPLLTDLVRVDTNIVWALQPAAWHEAADGNPPDWGSCVLPAGLERLACFRTEPDQIATIRYIQARTAADDPVYVGLARHDKIFVNDVLLYFALARPPATKWYHFDPGLQTSAPIQQQIIADLERSQPKLIVLEAKWGDEAEPNDSRLSDATLLDDYIRNSFEPVAQFGANTILQRHPAS